MTLESSSTCANSLSAVCPVHVERRRHGATSRGGLVVNFFGKLPELLRKR
jgi:hypothetical protein